MLALWVANSRGSRNNFLADHQKLKENPTYFRSGQDLYMLALFENPYRAARPTESQTPPPPTATKTNSKTLKSSRIPWSKPYVLKSKRYLPKGVTVTGVSKISNIHVSFLEDSRQPQQVKQWEERVQFKEVVCNQNRKARCELPTKITLPKLVAN